jgi:N-acetylmuramoyl-L-alanine amidase
LYAVLLIWTALILALHPQAASASSAERKQQAREQFEKAEQMREALNGRPADQRTRKDYMRVADAYRKVYYVAPASSKADASVIAVAEVLADMGRQFQPDEKDLRAAIGEYEFLRREYPGSKYRFQALFTIGQIYKEDLGDDEAAKVTFQEFLHRYPRHALAREAREALAELNRPAARNPVEEARAAEKSSADKELAKRAADEPPLEAPAAQPDDSQPPPAPKKKAPLALVTGIRHWSTPDYTRVAIDVDAEVKYEAGRVPDPDRIFFDLPNTKLASVLVGKSFEVRDGFLKKIRVAQYQPGYTRVVLEVADVSDYSAFLLPNPYRLIIDVHGRQPQTVVAHAAASEGGSVTAVEKEKSYRTFEKANEARSTAPIGAKTAPVEQGARSSPRDSGAAADAVKTNPRKVVVDNDDADDAADVGAPENRRKPSSNVATADASRPASPGNHASAKSTAKKSSSDQVLASAKDPDDPLFTEPHDSSGPELKATEEPTSAPTAIAVAPRSKDGKKAAKAAPGNSSHEAAPTALGDRNLTRTLGLKIGRIVIDAGHGGHDTGTIGPDGLMEKDLVLDVALRLGRLLETRLGADVIYTRDDDTFIPLETRTAIANQHQADLFISIHANSSSDPEARGVETYYLNFTSDPGALEVAARENAVSEKSIFQLQDLVKKITLKEKIDESRELASDVQQSLYSGLATRHSTLRDRGVKKAPFVVLIGANMPSILAEISFVSNPTDEAKLETPEYRQKIADSLYKGIAKYAGGLSGVKVAAKFNKDASQ